MAKTRYEAEVDVRTASGDQVTYQGVGYGPAGMSGDELLSGAEAAALAQEPGGEVIASRAREAH